MSNMGRKKTGKNKDNSEPVDDTEDVTIKLPLKEEDLKKFGLKKDTGSDKKLIKLQIDSEGESSDDSESASSDDDNERKLIKKTPTVKKKPAGACAGCFARDVKIKEMNTVIKELTENVKKTNGITNQSRTAIPTNLNIVDLDGKKWKTKTTLKCRWCMHGFKTIPIGIPDKYYKDTFYVFNIYCSFNCMIAHIDDLKGDKHLERISLAYKLYRIIHGDDVKYIKPADPIDVMIDWGGTKTIDEYRKDNLVLEKKSRIILPPVKSIIPVIENDPDTDMSIKDANVSLTNVNKRIRLKRTKSLVKNTGLNHLGVKLPK